MGGSKNPKNLTEPNQYHPHWAHTRICLDKQIAYNLSICNSLLSL